MSVIEAETGKPGTNWKQIGPAEGKKLAPLVKHYMAKAHPFTACVADNSKRFGPERAKKVCAVLKDYGRKSTKWRKGPSQEQEFAGALYEAAEGDIAGLVEMYRDSVALRLEIVIEQLSPEGFALLLMDPRPGRLREEVVRLVEEYQAIDGEPTILNGLIGFAYEFEELAEAKPKQKKPTATTRTVVTRGGRAITVDPANYKRLKDEGKLALSTTDDPAKDPNLRHLDRDTRRGYVKNQTGSASASRTGSQRGLSGGSSSEPARGTGDKGGQFISKNSGDRASTVAVQAAVGAKQDGQFGDKTQAAVRVFQQKHGLKVDGIVGKQTASAMLGNRSASKLNTGAMTDSQRKRLAGGAKKVRESALREELRLGGHIALSGKRKGKDREYIRVGSGHKTGGRFSKRAVSAIGRRKGESPAEAYARTAGKATPQEKAERDRAALARKVTPSKAKGRGVLPPEHPLKRPKPTPAELVKLDKGQLPENGALYFNNDDQDLQARYGSGINLQTVSMKDIEPVRARKDGIANAEGLMAKAAKGGGDRRAPITLLEKPGGGYEIYDGNSTFAIASKHGWDKIPAIVAKNQIEAKRIDALQGLEKRKRKHGQRVRAEKAGAKAVRRAEMDRIDDVVAGTIRIEETLAIRQEFDTFEELYASAEKTNPELEALLGRAATRFGTGGEAKMGPLKKKETSREKVKRKGWDKKFGEGRGHNGLADITRGTLVVESLDQLPAMMDSLRAEAKAKGWKIVNAENKFTDPPPNPPNEGPTPAGYADIQVGLLTPSGTIAELQITTKPLLDAKMGPGHGWYEKSRKIEGKAMEEGRVDAKGKPILNGVEKDRYEQLLNKQKGLYGGAMIHSYGLEGKDVAPAPGADRAGGSPKADAGSVPVNVGGDVELAAKLLGEGKKVRLNQPREASTLVKRLAEIVQESKAKGEKAPDFDLCNVTVKGTNLFCVESKGIPRVKMPQLSGVPTPGSRASKLPRAENGFVDLGPQFKEHLDRKGVEIENATEKASYLRASQNQLNGAKVASMTSKLDAGGKLGGDPRIFVSGDNYVVDGHHRWAAHVAHDLHDNQLGDVDMQVARVDMSIIELLAESNQFASDWGIPQASVTESLELVRSALGCGCN